MWLVIQLTKMEQEFLTLSLWDHLHVTPPRFCPQSSENSFAIFVVQAPLGWIQLHNNLAWPWLSHSHTHRASHIRKNYISNVICICQQSDTFLCSFAFCFAPPPALLGLLTYAKTAPVCLLLHFYSLLREIYGFVHIFHLFAFYDHASIDSVTITIRRAGSWPSYSTSHLHPTSTHSFRCCCSCQVCRGYIYIGKKCPKIDLNVEKATNEIFYNLLMFLTAYLVVRLLAYANSASVLAFVQSYLCLCAIKYFIEFDHIANRPL